MSDATYPWLTLLYSENRQTILLESVVSDEQDYLDRSDNRIRHEYSGDCIIKYLLQFFPALKRR